MGIYSKPDNGEIDKIWAQTAPDSDVKTPPDSYINRGWTQVKPPYEYFNWWMKNVSNFLGYTNQFGVGEWDNTTEYQAGKSFVQYKGRLWFCQKTAANSIPSDNNSDWKDYLKGIATQSYTDAAVNTFKNTLHKVAFSGQASDLQGLLPWTQLAGVPEWIRVSYDKDGQLYLKSPDGTSSRLGNSRLDFFNQNGRIVFSVNANGVIENGSIDVGKITGVLPKDKGGRGRSDNVTDMQYFDAYGGEMLCGFRFGGNDHNKITSGADDTDPEHSGNITIDTWNSLAVRSTLDNSFKTAWKLCARDGAVYQRGDFRFFGGGERTISNYGGSALWLAGDNDTKIRIGYNNFDFHNNKGKVLNIDPNANFSFTAGGQVLIRNTTGRVGVGSRYGDTLYIDDGNALSFQNSIGQERFAVHDGTGLFAGGLEVKDKTLMRNGLELYDATPYIDFHYGNSESDYTARIIADNDNRLKFTSNVSIGRTLSVDGNIEGGGGGDLNLRASTGNLVQINSVGDSTHLDSGNIWSIKNNANTVTVQWNSGRLTVGRVPVDRVDGLGGASHWEVQANSDPMAQGWGSGNLAREETIARLRSYIESSFVKASVWDKSGYNAEDIPFGSAHVPSIGVFRILCDYTKSMWGKWSLTNDWKDLGGNDRELLTTRQFVDYKNSLMSPGEVGSYVLAMNTRGEVVRFRETVSGSILIPAACDATSRYDDGSRLSGIWKCAGRSDGSNAYLQREKTTLYVRIA